MATKATKETETTTTDNQQPLTTIAEALLEIGETLESILALMQEREEGFKNRAARPSFGDRRPSFGDRKPYARKSYGDDNNDSEGGEEKPYRKSYERKSFGDKPAYGDKPSYGDKKPYAKKSFGDKPAYGEKKSFGGGKRSFGGDKKPAGPRKTYKGGY